VAAANLAGKRTKGCALEELLLTNGAVWLNIRVLDKRGTICFLHRLYLVH
jgi:hypothetical protein